MKFFTFLLTRFSFYVALIGIVLGVYLIYILNQPDPPPQPVALPAVNPFENAIAASGIIESFDRNISIGSPVSGIVKKIFIKVGDSVTTGEKLFEIDDRELQALLLTQKANVAVSHANIHRLKDQLERLEAVKDPRAISVEELKTRQNDVLIAEAQHLASESQVKQTQLLIERFTITSPQDGVILQNNIREGEYLSSVDSKPPLLLGNKQLQVRADIDEQNASHFNLNSPAFAYPKNNTTLKIPLKFDRLEPYIIPKQSLTGLSEERVDTRVLQVIYLFQKPENFNVFVGQQVDIYIQKEP